MYSVIPFVPPINLVQIPMVIASQEVSIHVVKKYYSSHEDHEVKETRKINEVRYWKYVQIV